MSLVINVAPDLKYKPVWLTGEIDFEVELTQRHLIQTSTGIRGGAAKEFEAQWQWAVDEWVRRMEQKGHIFVGLPAGYKPGEGWVKWRKDVIARGPYLPYDFTSAWDRKGDDGEEVSRRAPSSLEDTQGRVAYEMAAVFLVKEHILRQVVERDKNPDAYDAIKNAKKENGLWKPVPKPRKQYHVIGATRA